MTSNFKRTQLYITSFLLQLLQITVKHSLFSWSLRCWNCISAWYDTLRAKLKLAQGRQRKISSGTAQQHWLICSSSAPKSRPEAWFVHRQLQSPTCLLWVRLAKESTGLFCNLPKSQTLLRLLNEEQKHCPTSFSYFVCCIVLKMDKAVKF